MAYGARYPKSVSGRLLQPFACLEAELYPGTRVDKLKSCQLAAPMPQMELEQMAYGFLMAEMTERLTEQGEPSESLYLLLRRALQLLVKRNPRVAAMAYLIQLLDHCGIGPVYEVCVQCSRPAEGDGWFSEMQGGFVTGTDFAPVPGISDGAADPKPGVPAADCWRKIANGNVFAGSFQPLPFIQHN